MTFGHIVATIVAAAVLFSFWNFVIHVWAEERHRKNREPIDRAFLIFWTTLVGCASCLIIFVWYLIVFRGM